MISIGEAALYDKPGQVEITYSNKIKQTFELIGPDDYLIVYHSHTARYL